ncbi:MAG: hypothetical protein EOP04_20335, partial [Proteobacteria bacterium]
DSTTHGGVYGTKGVAAASNQPGGRLGMSLTSDSQGKIWMFGGQSRADNIVAGSFPGYANDLWMFDGQNWTWVSGGNVPDDTYSYGVKGVVDPTNMPRARWNNVLWGDNLGNIWIFGGYARGNDYLNDLWKFDGTNWVWVTGDDDNNEAAPTYGPLGLYDPTYTPGARIETVGWTDDLGNLWLGGGYGRDDGTFYRIRLNDMWKFTP